VEVSPPECLSGPLPNGLDVSGVEAPYSVGVYRQYQTENCSGPPRDTYYQIFGAPDSKYSWELPANNQPPTSCTLDGHPLQHCPPT
jgi:hypothetical protein